MDDGNMNILGLTHPISWNTAACIISDGELIAFTEEERFTRDKHAKHSFPKNAIWFCLDKSGLRAEDIDLVAVGFQNKNYCGNDPAGNIHTEPYHEKTKEGLASLNITADVKLYNHHVSHVASAFMCSGFRSSNCYSLDGAGDDSVGWLGHSEGFFSDLYSITNASENTPFPSTVIGCGSSWGTLYEDVTDILGFRRHSGEGKTMGLAAYGNLDEDLLPLFSKGETGCPDNVAYKKFFNKRGWTLSMDYYGKKEPKASVDPLSGEGKNLAHTLQSYYNDFLIRTAKKSLKETGCPNFCLAGGVALNCTANGSLASQDFVDNIFIQPASHDAGTALGAALLAYWEKYGKFAKARFPHAYWGKEYTQDEIRLALINNRLSFKEVDPSVSAAELLSDNKIVCFFQGRAEVGPRALGNRSILANPIESENLHKINKLKGREPWRPLAPSILEDDYHEVVECKHHSPFMLMATQVKEEYKEKIPAVVHVDGSCRPQTVYKQTNPIFYETILEFKKRTGIPVVLNTSFNLWHEPIVNSPMDAIKTWKESGADALIMGNFLVEK